MSLQPDQPRPNYPIVGFVAGTPILTPEGSTPIEQLRPGDVIQSQPEDVSGDHDDASPDRWHFN